MKAYVLKIKPNKKQQAQIDTNIDAYRFVFNKLLEMTNERYKNSRKFEEDHNLSKYTIKDRLTKFDYGYLIKPLRQEHPWLKQADSSTLRMAGTNLYNAIQKQIKGQGGKPKFKSRFSPKQSYPSNTVLTKNTNSTKVYSGRIVKNHYIVLPKLGTVKCSTTERIEHAPIKTFTINKLPNGKYTLSINIEYDPDPNAFGHTNQAIGIDVNIRNLLTLSDGKKYPTFEGIKNQDQIKKWQSKYSRRYHKAKLLIAQDKNKKVLIPRTLDDFKNVKRARSIKFTKQRKLAEARAYYQQWITTELVKKYDIIVIEDLSVKKMLQNEYLAKQIANASWYQFRTMLEYKCKWYNKQLVVVDPADTTRICHECKFNYNKSILKQTWECPNCHKINDVDINAAQNILDKGLKQLDDEKKKKKSKKKTTKKKALNN